MAFHFTSIHGTPIGPGKGADKRILTRMFHTESGYSIYVRTTDAVCSIAWNVKPMPISLQEGHGNELTGTAENEAATGSGG